MSITRVETIKRQTRAECGCLVAGQSRGRGLGLQPITRSNHYRTTKQHAIVSIQLNIVTRPTYPEKLMRDNVVAPFFKFLLSLSQCHHDVVH